MSTSQEISLNVINFKLKNSGCQERLGVKFDLLGLINILQICLKELAEKYTH